MRIILIGDIYQFMTEFGILCSSVVATVPLFYLERFQCSNSKSPSSRKL